MDYKTDTLPFNVTNIRSAECGSRDEEGYGLVNGTEK
jgi:hypothetical protein